MHSVSAHEAKARFGQLLDAARTQPVTIEKHGRPVAVVVSKEEFDAMETMKLERLRAEVQKGIDAIERGDYLEFEVDELDQLFKAVKAKGRKLAGRE